MMNQKQILAMLNDYLYDLKSEITGEPTSDYDEGYENATREVILALQTRMNKISQG